MPGFNWEFYYHEFTIYCLNGTVLFSCDTVWMLYCLPVDNSTGLVRTAAAVHFNHSRLGTDVVA